MPCLGVVCGRAIEPTKSGLTLHPTHQQINKNKPVIFRSEESSSTCRFGANVGCRWQVAMIRPGIEALKRVGIFCVCAPKWQKLRKDCCSRVRCSLAISTHSVLPSNMNVCVCVCVCMPQFAAVDSAKSICVCIAIPYLSSSLRSTTLSRRDLGCKTYRWRHTRTRGGLLQVGNSTLASISPYSCTSCSFPFHTESSCCDGDGEHGVDTSRGIATTYRRK